MQRIISCVVVLAVGALAPAMAAYQSDSRGPHSPPTTTWKTEMSQSATPSATPETPPAAGAAPEDSQDDISIGEIPAVETVELQAESTRKAIDAYALVKDKYKDSGMENYDDLQEFVDKAEDGKKLEADIKAAGFGSVNEWNLIITTASLTYSNIIDDQTDDIQQQIDEIKLDTELAQDMKDRLTKSLQAMVPSENNRNVIDTLMKDPTFSEKAKLLEIEEE
jgi:hypothetical protein